MSKRIILIDDEQNIIEAIQGIIEVNLNDVEIVGIAKGVEEAVALLKSRNTDIVLLDVQMRDGTGFDVLKRMPDLDAKVIFITAYEEFAIRGFEFNALDYLLKPVDPELLKQAIDKAVRLIDLENQSLQLSQLFNYQREANPRKIVLKTLESIHLVDLDDVIRCEAQRNYTVFHLKESKAIMVSRTLKEFETTLSASGFFRIHQSHLINLSHFKKYDKRDGGVVLLKDNSAVPISTRKREELMQQLEKLSLGFG